MATMRLTVVDEPRDRPAWIRETLDKRYEGYQKRLKKLNNEDVFQMFMNAYAMAIEPHTNYLGPRSAESFDIAMRLSLDGIGADHVVILFPDPAAAGDIG